MRSKVRRDVHGFFINIDGIYYRPVVSARSKQCEKTFELTTDSSFAQDEEVRVIPIDDFPVCKVESLGKIPTTELWSLHADLYRWSPATKPVITG